MVNMLLKKKFILNNNSRERVLVEVFMHRRCIDVTGRSVNNTFSPPSSLSPSSSLPPSSLSSLSLPPPSSAPVAVDFSLSRAILECVETLVKDYFKLSVRISIPCIFIDFYSFILILIIIILTIFKAFTVL